MKREVGINQLKRRDFLKAGLVFGAGAAGLAAGYAAVPDAFARAVYAAKKEGASNDNVLVMIQLAGGNDGLRTLVPLADPALHDLGPGLPDRWSRRRCPLTLSTASTTTSAASRVFGTRARSPSSRASAVPIRRSRTSSRSASGRPATRPVVRSTAGSGGRWPPATTPTAILSPAAHVGRPTPRARCATCRRR